MVCPHGTLREIAAEGVPRSSQRHEVTEDMGIIWFCLVAILLAAYVVLDGSAIGAGILYPWIARGESERRAVVAAAGPVWRRDEVWLLATGAALWFAFPSVYAAAYSGFYPIGALILALLVVRAVAVAFRAHTSVRPLAATLDACLAVASILLALSYGVLLGNVVRGVPLDARGHFFEPLWTNFHPAGQTGILDTYTLLLGATTFGALALHGAVRLAAQFGEELRDRALRIASQLWWLVALLTVAITFTTSRLLPRLVPSFRARPWGFVFPVLAIAGFLGIKWFVRERRSGVALGASCAYLIGMIASIAFVLYPSVLPTSMNPVYGGLTVSRTMAAAGRLKMGLIWWAVGVALVAAYTILAHRRVSGEVLKPEAIAREEA
jgi:cytochrome d ubiquinol oxidase subunit II